MRLSHCRASPTAADWGEADLAYAMRHPSRTMPLATTCGNCGAALAPFIDDGGVRKRGSCPECGGDRLVFSDEGTVSARAVLTGKHSVHVGNQAIARLRQLQADLADVKRAVDANDAGDAQTSVKRALEAIHELLDCMTKRGEWSQSDWAPDQIGIWRAHLGARNAAHHTSSSVVAMHGEPIRDERLRWDIHPKAVAMLNSAAQRREYNAHLAGQPVLPALRDLCARLAASIS